MNCKVYHLQDKNITSTSLSKIPNCNNFKIITDDPNVKNILDSLNYNCEDLTELFPNVDLTTFQIYESATKSIDEYRKSLDEIKFLDISIFNILEPLLRDDFVLLEKISHILQKKENVIFLLKNNSHILFLINKLSKQFEYETENKINTIKNEKIHQIDSLKKSKSIKSKLFLKFNRKSKKTIFRSIEEKLQNKKNSCTIFLTPSTKYVLNPIFSVLNEFKKNLKPYSLISFDHELIKELKKDNLSIIDFSRDALILSSIIKNSTEGKKLFNKILQISKNKNLEIIYYNGIINEKISKIFRFLAMLEISLEIFKNIETKSTVIAFDGNSMGNSITLAAKNQDVKSYSICSLYILPHAIMKLDFLVDFILVYGTHAYETLITLGYPREKIIITGNVMYDYFKKIDFKKSKKEVTSKLELEQNKPLIVIGCGRWYPKDEIWISKFIKFCNLKNFNLIIKVHPIYLTTQNHIHKKIVDEIQKKCSELKYTINIEMNASTLVSAADLVITDQTNLGIEAGLLGKPWLTVNFQNENKDFLFKTSEQMKHSIYLSNYSDLEIKSLEILHEHKYEKLFLINQQEMIEKFNFIKEVNSRQKIFSILNNL